jgi:hypothetical protein
MRFSGGRASVPVSIKELKMRFSLPHACFILCVALAGAIAVSRALADDAETRAHTDLTPHR